MGLARSAWGLCPVARVRGGVGALGQWGFASPYLRVAAFVKHEKPAQLLDWLPDAQMSEDPFFLENLLAILYADGKPQWTTLEEASP